MNDIVIGFTLDRSGSMTNIWDDAQGGFNAFKNEQAAVVGDAWIILTAFDHEVLDVYDAWNAEHIPDLPEVAGDFQGEIKPRGSTALLDATAHTIHRTEKWLEENPWFDGQVLQVINTDGYENASEEWTNDKLKDLIESKKTEGWEFVYMAANVDAWATGGGFGIHAGSTMSYDSNAASVRNSYQTLSAAVTASRTGQRDTSDGLFEPEEQKQ